MNPGKIKNKKYPLTYVGHCDFDLRTQNYPCKVAYPQGPCLPVTGGVIGGCTEHGNYPGHLEGFGQVPVREFRTGCTPYRTTTGACACSPLFGCTPGMSTDGTCVCMNAWGDRWYLPPPGTWTPGPDKAFSAWWTAIIGALGAVSAYALNAWANLKNAKTDQQKQAMMERIYQDHQEGRITDEEYKLLLAQYGGYLDQETQDQLMWANWWKKYKYFVLGGAGLFFMFFMFSMKR